MEEMLDKIVIHGARAHNLKNIDVEINDVQTKIENQEDKEEILKKYTHIDKLTIPIVQEFIDSIFISEVTKDGQRNITINMAI